MNVNRQFVFVTVFQANVFIFFVSEGFILLIKGKHFTEKNLVSGNNIV